LLKKCLTWQAALRIILKCTDERDFGKCVLNSVTGQAKECVLNCLEAKEQPEESPECVKKVEEARKHFHRLNDKEKKSFCRKSNKKTYGKSPKCHKRTN